jgi:hypothetical protein
MERDIGETIASIRKTQQNHAVLTSPIGFVFGACYQAPARGARVESMAQLRASKEHARRLQYWLSVTFSQQPSSAIRALHLQAGNQGCRGSPKCNKTSPLWCRHAVRGSGSFVSSLVVQG